MSWLLLPDGEIADGVAARAPDLRFTTYDTATEANLADVEFYVPPYMGDRATVDLLARLPRLRVVQTLTIGVDWIRHDLADGILLCNAAGVHEESTAELVVAGMLAAIKRIPTFVRAQQDHDWDHRRVGAVAGSTVMVLGHGAIGSAVAARLAGFGVEIIAVTHSGRGTTQTLEAVRDRLGEVDVLVITVPLTAATRGLVDAELLASLPTGAIVINAARGPVVDATALEVEVLSGRIRAVLDVTDPEPLPPESPLWAHENVLITPHVGGDTTRFPDLGCQLVTEQVRRFLQGEPLVNRIPPKAAS